MSSPAPVIIKKIKKGHGHGHHGGAWKVAYADFVTAMMAFFLLLWLLNATEAENLAGLADYFAPTVGVKDAMGIGFRGGKAALAKGIGADKSTNRGIVFGGVPSGPIVKVTEEVKQETQEEESEQVKLVIAADASEKKTGEAAGTEETPQMKALKDAVRDVAKESGLEQSVDLVETPEGLAIQIKDRDNDSMFEPGSAALRAPAKQMLEKLGEVLSHMPNYLSIAGHTSSMAAKEKKDYGNWELSSDRANAARRALVQSGVQEEQIARVIGRADNDPLDEKNPEKAENNRISVVLLRQSLTPSHKKAAPEQPISLETNSSEAKELTAPIQAEKKPAEKKPDDAGSSGGPAANPGIKDALREVTVPSVIAPAPPSGDQGGGEVDKGNALPGGVFDFKKPE